MKIGHYQLECEPGNYEGNLSKLINGLCEADEQQIDVISFPESFLTGYLSNSEKAKKYSFSLNSPEIRNLLEKTSEFKAMFMVGFNELRDDGNLYNTVLVTEHGELKGTYSKAFPCYDYFTPGRDFPVFEKDGVKFGVVICADGGYIEPTRILALKGVSIIFAPHYNYIGKEGLINHFQKVRSDHIARAVENSVWFVRGNNICSGYDSGLEMDGVGYGDSYILDPFGEIVARSERHVECLISSTINTKFPGNSNRSFKSGTELGKILLETIDQREKNA